MQTHRTRSRSDAGVTGRRRWIRKPAGRSLALSLALLAGVMVTQAAQASHDAETSLSGSNFEIDPDANLIVDDGPPSIDWAGVTEMRTQDVATGRTDDSYAGGAKEDDPCPGTTTGSIPNNKSDLLTFGAYVESEASGPGYLHLFWTRVQEPSGTTLMDFELNQSGTDCGNGANRVRSVGDLLIEYRIEQGGSTATLKAREWTGSAWGPGQDLTAINAATGTINSSAIPGGESDGLVPSSSSLSPRTFGEMSLDLDFIFDANECQSFGSAFLKSRASDSFQSQLKDFIKPISVGISNCGNVVIRKETVPASDPAVTTFGFTKSFDTAPATADTFSLGHGEAEPFTNVLFGSGYTVSEDDLPEGWVLDSLDCTASTGVTPTTDGATVTFDIDSTSDVLDCTYTNKQQTGAVKITKTRKHAASGPGDHPHSGVDFTVTGGGLPAEGVAVTTDADGIACLDGLIFSSAAGDYTVTEEVPDGYRVESQNPQTVTVDQESTCGDGNEETVSFNNTPLTDITVSVNSQVDGGTASTITCTGVPAVSTDSNGDGTLTLGDLEPGTYTCTIVVDP